MADIMAPTPDSHWQAIADALPTWAAKLGFDGLGVTGIALDADAAYLRDWLAREHHGSMQWMARHADLRSNPASLHPGTIRVISVRLPYLPESRARAEAALGDASRAYISRYALGRDYHKLMRKRLKALATRLEAQLAQVLPEARPDQRPFVDSGPVLEKALARDARLGWIGKHTLLLTREQGSFFFLGELLTNLPLPETKTPPVRDLCGSCSACIDVCPTQAIIGPQQLDARRCIAYLTIEHDGPIPLELRAPIGNRIFGCDDCQLVCPWNRHATPSREADFAPRHGLDTATLLDLWAWDEATWLCKTEGMALRRAGWRGWRRNLAVALGNAPASGEAVEALEQGKVGADDLVAEHIDWALERKAVSLIPSPSPKGEENIVPSPRGEGGPKGRMRGS